MEKNNTEILSFDGLGIKDTILEQIKKMGLTSPTPIQFKTIPIGLAGQDLIGVAQTGTGKTFAFGIPAMQRIGAMGGRALVLLPTRELALQVEESLKSLGGPLGLKTASFIGGEAMDRQLYALRKNPHVIVATPGRLTDYLKRKFLTLDNINVLVLDEADMMFDMGFAPQVEEILTYIKHEHQTMLFSATMPVSIVKLAAKHMRLPVSIEAAPPGTTAEKVDQEIYILHKDDKASQLEKILNDYQGSVLIFVRTRQGVKGLTEHLNKLSFTAEEIHSNLSLSQRRRSLANFKSGKSRILVATDIAARGLDVSGIELVVNYHLPDKLSDYVHRIGRTARAGKSGKAISFATADQGREIRDIEKLISQDISLNEIVPLRRPSSAPRSNSRSRSGGGSMGARRSFAPRPGRQNERPTTGNRSAQDAFIVAQKPARTFSRPPFQGEITRHSTSSNSLVSDGRRRIDTDKQRFKSKMSLSFFEERPAARSSRPSRPGVDRQATAKSSAMSRPFKTKSATAHSSGFTSFKTPTSSRGPIKKGYVAGANRSSKDRY